MISDVNPSEILCTPCGARYRLYRDARDYGPAHYCPMCGSREIAFDTKPEREYWLALAEDIGLPPLKSSAELVEQLFALWAPEAGDPHRFGDFVRRAITDS